MKNFTTLFFIILLFSSFQMFAQQIVEGTHSNRGTGSYYPMVFWEGSPSNTSAYDDYHLAKNNGDYLMNFRLLKPNGYDPANTQKKYPMILMMHGKGESGNLGFTSTDPRYFNNDKNLLWGGREHILAVNRDPSHEQAFPGFVFFPQNASGDWSPFLASVEQTLELLLDEYNIDPNRIYLHGLSAGATGGVWKMIERRPDLFAAFLPMSGSPSYPNAFPYSEVVHIPLWLFQGEVDDTGISTLHKADITIREMREAGASPRYTVYGGVGHATWNRAYAEPDFFSWMLGYSKLSIFAYDGKTEFCEGDAVNAKLGITPGDGYNYEWSKNDVLIPNSNTNEITVTDYGYYKVRFERPIRGWTAWSDSVVIGIKEPTPRVEITADGTTVFPSPDNKETVTLSAPEGYESYSWSSGQTSRSITVNRSQAGSYRVKVTEVDGCPSSFSLPVVVVNNGETMVAPGNLSANTVNETQINLFWTDKSTTEKGFEIFRATSAGGPYTFIALTNPDEIFFEDKNLASNTTYYYVIRAVSTSGSSPKTQEVSATTDNDTESPSIPQDVYAEGNIDLSSITLTWKASTDNVAVTEYEVYRVNNDNSLTFIDNTTENSFKVPNLTENSHHTFVVVAKDQNGNASQPSNRASATVTFCGLNFNLYKDGTWDFINQLKANQIHERGRIGYFDINIINKYFPQDKNYFGFDFEGYIYITTPGEYTFTTRSDDGSMLWIDDLSGTPVVSNDGRHGAQDRSGVKTLTQGRHKIKVTYFDAKEGETLVVSYRGPDTGGNTIPIPSDVLCSNPNVTVPQPPAVPSNLVANATSTSTIALSWTDNSSNETGFELYRKKADGDYTLINTPNAGTTTYEDTGLEANTTYYYKLRAIGTTGESAFTDAGRLTYSFYQGSWTVLPNFDNLAPIRSGDINNFDIKSKADPPVSGNNYDNFAFEFDGKILIETAGDYYFFTSSDDGSQLFINGSLVVNNDGAHGKKEVSSESAINLSAGLHDIRVTFFEAGGGEVLEVRYQGPGISKRLIPDAVLNTTLVKATTLEDTEAPEAAPEEFTVESVGSTSVVLSWLPSELNSGIAEYHIYDMVADTLLAKTGPKGHIIRNGSTSGGGNTSLLSESTIDDDKGSASNNRLLSEEATPAKITTQVSGLISGQNYTLAVRAVDGSGNFSPFSNPVAFETNSEQPLPIELLDFYAMPENGYVDINWVTASEQNNDYFTLERSLDGKEFRTIVEIDGQGDSNELQFYNHRDYAPINGAIYYRLKQTDTNGVFVYSKIIRIHYNKGLGEFDFTVFPNPVNTSDFTIQLSSSNNESKVLVRIIDVVGREYYRELIAPEILSAKMTISKGALTPGIYIVSVQQADQLVQKKIIVQ